ncbi:hypothetical protein Glove_562g16 [Diversispora epigaea]|uniref:Helitron helicase-like domain-containing protein n=1 Tax=Diversispora epigaea TaxID=1348612 RepID=A0A397GJ12_9GLOM|nr:hypothetical protein Glove_562g16 [Diversispora epigaea]
MWGPALSGEKCRKSFPRQFAPYTYYDQFQNRGAAHTHGVFWTNKTIEEMINENTIRSDIPDPQIEPELYQLVMNYQIHTCNERCGAQRYLVKNVGKVSRDNLHHILTMTVRLYDIHIVALTTMING